MTYKVFWHKTIRNNSVIVAPDVDISEWPDYDDHKGEHHMGHTPEELELLSQAQRKLRDEELKRTDYLMLQDMNPSQELIDYRQALRDAPAHEGWPLNPPNIIKWK